MMDKKKQQALFEVQLFLPYEIKADKLKRDVTVSLPASEEQLEQVRESIGAASLAQYRLIQVASPIQGLEDYLPPGYDLKGLNTFAKAAFSKGILSSEEQAKTLMAALEAELPEDMEAATGIAEELEQYEFLPMTLQSPGDYARYIQEKENIQVDKALEPFVDFEGFGKYRMNADGVVQTGHGLVWRKDRLISQPTNELEEIRFFSPLKAEMNYKNDWGDLSDEPVELWAGDLCSYEEAIQRQIEKERLVSEGNRGLAAYLDNHLMSRKIVSMVPTVEAWQGRLWGVLEVKSHGPLSPGMLNALMEEWSGQESDGWGEGFEQRPIQTLEGELYVSFWNSGHDFFIATEEQLKGLEQESGMQMGGM